jgi:hypothetical protein
MQYPEVAKSSPNDRKVTPKWPRADQKCTQMDPESFPKTHQKPKGIPKRWFQRLSFFAVVSEIIKWLNVDDTGSWRLFSWGPKYICWHVLSQQNVWKQSSVPNHLMKPRNLNFILWNVTNCHFHIMFYMCIYMCIYNVSKNVFNGIMVLTEFEGKTNPRKMRKPRFYSELSNKNDIS